MAAAALIAAAFAVPVTASQAVSESYQARVIVIFFCIVTAGMFAFVSSAGAFLHVARADRAPAGGARRLVHACVLAAAAVPVALAFRATLWSLVGANPQRSGLLALWLVIGCAAAITFALTLGIEHLVPPRQLAGRAH